MVLYSRSGKDIDKGLIGYWKLDDLKISTSTAIDRINFNDGIINGAVNAEGINGKSPDAMYFDGTDDNIVIADSDELDGHPEMTWAFWMRPSDVNKDNAGILDKYVTTGDERSWRIYHFHDTSESAKVKQTGEIFDNAALRPDASNLAAFLYLLQETQPQHYNRIVKTIRLAAPFFEDFVLRPLPLNPNKIQLEWRETGSDAYFNAYSLSDGTLRLMCLATLLLQPELPSTVLITSPVTVLLFPYPEPAVAYTSQISLSPSA